MNKFIVAQKMEAIETENSIVGTASTQKMDRDKEIILSSAWKLDNYRRNPVICLSHSYSDLPIGKAIWIKAVANEGLRFKCKFANTERGREVFQLYQEGILNSFSVGFSPLPGGVIDNPTQKEYRGAKRLFTDVELLEISCVAIPANSDAVIDKNESFRKYVKSGKIICKELNNELEAIIEIIEKDESPVEIKDDEINIEVKDEDIIETKETDEVIEKEEVVEEVKEVDVSIIKAEEVVETKETDEIDIKEIEDIITKAKVTVNADEKEEDFMSRCMGSMNPKLPEKLRQRSCEMIWSKKDVTIEETKDVNPDEIKAMSPTDEEDLDAFMVRCMADVQVMASNPEEADRTTACQMIWDKKNPKEIEEEDIETKLSDDEIETKLSDDEIVKGLQDKLAELKTTVEKMHPMPSETAIASSDVPVTKTVDSKGNPSLYDLTSAIGMALNDPKNALIINPEGEPGCYCSVVDIYATEYPNGHIVYSEYCVNEPCEFYQIDYKYDSADHKASLVGTPVPVLQSWVEDRYGDQETMMKSEDEIITKEGRVLSDANRQLLMDCMTQMNEAIMAVSNLVAATSKEPKQAITVEDLFKSEVVDEIKEIVKEAVEKEIEEVDTKSPDELEIDDLVELDIETKSVETFEVEDDDDDDDEMDLDEDVIKNAIANAMAKVAKGIDVKGMVGEAVAKRLGRVIL